MGSEQDTVVSAPGPTDVAADRYELTQRIAAGGMGEVWRGVDTRLGRAVAVKLMLPTIADDETFRERFRAEARAAAAVNHPSVVAVYDYGEQQDEAGRCRSFIVMELVDGHSLAEDLRR